MTVLYCLPILATFFITDIWQTRTLHGTPIASECSSWGIWVLHRGVWRCRRQWTSGGLAPVPYVGIWVVYQANFFGTNPHFEISALASRDSSATIVHLRLVPSSPIYLSAISDAQLVRSRR